MVKTVKKNDMQILNDVARSLNDDSKKIKKEGDESLSGALRELSREITSLSTQKIKLERDIEDINTNETRTQTAERTLKIRLAKLEELETKLLVEKGTKEHKLSDIKNKISRIKRIRQELAE